MIKCSVYSMQIVKIILDKRYHLDIQYHYKIRIIRRIIRIVNSDETF